MSASLEQLHAWMQDKENEHLEFKEAKHDFDFELLVKYCVALANEGGGRILLGVTNKEPRCIVGSQAFQTVERTKAGLIDRLHLRVEVEEVLAPDGRVVVCVVPSRPAGFPISYKGAYWMRAGEDLVPMTADMLRRIFAETGPDYSAEICPGATLVDLDAKAIHRFRTMWSRKSGNRSLDQQSDTQLLTDADLIADGQLTYAALVLLGTRRGLSRHLAQAEVIFEYRSSEASGPSQHRNEYREGFLLFADELWDTINLRNDVQHFQDGLFVWDIPTFSEVVVREAILNAVSHRDYRLAGSVFVRQFPRRLEIVSPGGFLPGVTPENILWRQAPRNRRIAEAFAKCGLVERAGQGVNRMFEGCIKESKPQPDFSDSDDYQVSVVLRSEIQDPQFLRFLEKVGAETLASFTTQDLLILDLVNRSTAVPEELRPRLATLVERGIVEPVGRGKGTRYLLSRAFYGFMGKKGVYTRKRGLDRETNKALLLQHIQDNRREGSRMEELTQVLPTLSRDQVKTLLRDLRAQRRIHPIGRTKAARWYPGPGPDVQRGKDDFPASTTQS